MDDPSNTRFFIHGWTISWINYLFCTLCTFNAYPEKNCVMLIQRKTQVDIHYNSLLGNSGDKNMNCQKENSDIAPKATSWSSSVLCNWKGPYAKMETKKDVIKNILLVSTTGANDHFWHKKGIPQLRKAKSNSVHRGGLNILWGNQIQSRKRLLRWLSELSALAKKKLDILVQWSMNETYAI